MRPVKSCSDSYALTATGQRLARIRLGRKLRDLAAISFGEELGLLLGALEIGGEARGVHAFVQILKAPFRQRAKIRRGRGRRQSGIGGMELRIHQSSLCISLPLTLHVV